jgi:hypothetical protein|tara:strand:- start:44 stop:511 length:468 start_codon:yes stop_codon:yes gene_type:complete
MKTARMPKTKLEDYLKFNEERNQLGIKLIKGDITKSMFDLSFFVLEDKYNGKVFPEDEYNFPTFCGLCSFVGENDLSSRYLFHELKHAQKARDLGYNPSFQCMLTYMSEGVISMQLSVTFGNYIPPEDSVQILSAPDEMSPGDSKSYDKLIEGAS